MMKTRPLFEKASILDHKVNFSSLKLAFHTCLRVNYAKMIMYLHLWHFLIIELWWIMMQTILPKMWRCMLMIIIFFIHFFHLLFLARQNSDLWPFYACGASGFPIQLHLIIFLLEFVSFLLRGFCLFFVRAYSSFCSGKTGPFSSNFSSFTIIVLLCLYLLLGFTNQDFKRPI